MNLSEKLAAHPKFRFEAGMLCKVRSEATDRVTRHDVRMLGGVPYKLEDYIPDLTDAATAGVLLLRLAECGSCEVLYCDYGNGLAWFVGSLSSSPAWPVATSRVLGEAATEALLAAWETTPVLVQNTAIDERGICD